MAGQGGPGLSNCWLSPRTDLVLMDIEIDGRNRAVIATAADVHLIDVQCLALGLVRTESIQRSPVAQICLLTHRPFGRRIEA